MIGELQKIFDLINKEDRLKSLVRPSIETEIKYKNKNYPIYSFSIGSESPTAPTLFITGGVHGLERVGAQLAWSLLKTTIDTLLWDRSRKELFQHVRLVFAPLLNPVGYLHFKRSNGNNVDLMRNSPIISEEKTPFLVGGQRISDKIPWYQGQEGILEPESQALVQLFKKEALQSSCVIAVDFHSGFGMKDRLWFPFSHTRKIFDNLAEMHSLTHLFEDTHPYHIYQIEPQSDAYLLHGDLWDFLYLDYKEKNRSGIFLPLTLEMGSWTWVKKNPLQIFSKHGAFNPIKEHRLKRTYRRHHLLFDFLLKALYSNQIWSHLEAGFKHKHHQLGLEKWYKS